MSRILFNGLAEEFKTQCGKCKSIILFKQSECITAVYHGITNDYVECPVCEADIAVKYDNPIIKQEYNISSILKLK